NLTSDGTRTYSWDAENRLVAIAYPGQPGKATTFAYDGLGRRVQISSTPAGGGTAVVISYLWCGTRLCQARNAAGTVTKGYYAEGEYAPGSPGVGAYYAPDQVGSVRRAVTAASSPAYDNDPCGNTLQGTAPVTDFVYAGLLYNPDSGLLLATNRVYNPAIGRWLSRDPAGESADPQGNLYAYVGGNPVGLTDVHGLGPGGCLGAAALGAALGATAGAGLELGLDALTTAALDAPAIEVGLALDEALTAADEGAGLAAGLADGAADPAIEAAADSAVTDAEVGAATNIGATESASEGYSSIGSTGQIGEATLQELGGESQVYFRSNLGARYVDQLVNGIANESEVGYQSLNQVNRLQILKDADLTESGQISGSTWHFFPSPVTGLGGPSAPLASFLEQNGNRGDSALI
ncbi:MAG: RHS repeat-associated core domain-containing protein, partial [Caulobacteraceae bacterium]